jgi:hypothetical protein
VFDTQEEAAKEYYNASTRFGRTNHHDNNSSLQTSSAAAAETSAASVTATISDRYDHLTAPGALEVHIPLKLLTALKLKLQLGKATLQLHCEQLHIQEMMAKIDNSPSSSDPTDSGGSAYQSVQASVAVHGYQENIAARLNTIRQLQEEQTNLSYQLANIDLSDMHHQDLERFGIISTYSTTATLFESDRTRMSSLAAEAVNRNLLNYHTFTTSSSSVSSGSSSTTTTSDK